MKPADTELMDFFWSSSSTTQSRWKQNFKRNKLISEKKNMKMAFGAARHAPFARMDCAGFRNFGCHMDVIFCFASFHQKSETRFTIL
jgi:hypothetical protein